MGAETERSEGTSALREAGPLLAAELRSTALGLPDGWFVVLEPSGQIRLLPPSVAVSDPATQYAARRHVR